MILLELPTARAALWLVATILIAVGAVELAPSKYISDLIAIGFAVTGAAATQLNLLAKQEVNWPLIGSEVVFAALGGFCVHAALMENIDQHRIIWGASAVVGAGGSTAFRNYGRRYLGHWAMFEGENDDGRGDGD